MKKNEKLTLMEVESGTIDIAFNGTQQLLQFNCSCKDALPYCNAVCCRNRPHYNVLLTKDEEDQFEKKIQFPTDPKLYILDHKDGACAYLDAACEDGYCSVHASKPAICKRWHCSPNGVGEGLDLFDDGWVLTPGQGDLQHEELRRRIKERQLQR